jgi:ABC-2 type transport system ATP-binding protein
MDSPIIQAEDITKMYPSRGKSAPVEAVRGISFNVAAGEFFGILGPNGAGKSTIIGCMTTLIRPTSGSIRIAGFDVLKDAAKVKRRIAVVPQARNLDQSLTVREILNYHGRYFGVPTAARRTRVEQLITDMGVADKADAKPGALSGGTQQRVMIARALMHEPSILLLDEPTTGLDPQSRRQLWETLRELHRRGLTIILTTHYMEEADQLCQRLAFIDRGRILISGTPAALKSRSHSERILDLSVFSSTVLAPHLSRLAGVSRVETLEANGCNGHQGAQRLRLFLASADGVVNEVLSVFRREKADLHHFSVLTPSLEDIYIQLTGKELRQ